MGKVTILTEPLGIENECTVVKGLKMKKGTEYSGHYMYFSMAVTLSRINIYSATKNMKKKNQA